MRYAFDVTLYTRPADKAEHQKRRVVVYAEARAEAVEKFWTGINRAGFGVGFIPVTEGESDE